MKIQNESLEIFKKEILEIVSKHLDGEKYKIFFFGSRVNGKGSDRSDIDIGIEGEKAIPFEKKALIDEDIENMKTLYTIEIVDFKKVSSDFYEVAKQDIEFLN